MAIPLSLLIAMDSEDDALLIVRELQRGGYNPRWDRVWLAKAFAEKLDEGNWELIISEFAMPGFGGLEALAMVREKDPDLPVILLSRGIGEEAAVEAIKAGASDCILKDNLDRLPAAVERELRNSELLQKKTAFYRDLVEKARIKDSSPSFLDIDGKKSERLYRLLTENANDVIWSCDLDMAFQYVSPSVEKLLGWIPDEVIEAGATMTLPPESLRLATGNLQTVLNQYQSGKRVFEPITFEIELNRKDGTRVWTEVNASPFFDDDGRMVGISGVTRNISERKKAESELLQAKQEWERTFDTVPDLIAILDDRHRILRANRAMAERLGLTPEQCIGQTCYESFHGTNEPIASCPNVLSLADGQEHTTEVHEERLGGDFLVSCTPLFDEEGARIGLVHLARDITERKRVSEALHRSEEKFRGIFENTLIGIFQATLEGRYLTVNPACARIFGYKSPEDMISSITDIGRQIYVRSGDRETVIASLISTGNLESFLIEARKKDGSDIWVALNSRLVRDEHGAILLIEGMVEDVTIRKRWEEVLAESDQFSREIITHANEGIVVYDRELRYVVWNRFMENLTGMKSKDVLGHRAIDLIPHIREHGIDQIMNRALRGESTSSADVPFHAPQTGKTGWVKSTFSPHMNAQGEIIGVIGMIHDVTERKKSEVVLRQSEEKFSKAFRSSPVLKAITMGDSTIVDVNEKWLQTLGYSRDEVLGQRITDLGIWHNPDQRKELIQWLKKEQSFREVLVQAVTKTGDERDIYLSGEFIRVDGRDLLLTSGRDATDELKAQKALRESETRFRQLIENAPDGIFVQTGGRIVYVNNALLRMFGARSEEELLGRPFMEHIHPDFHDRVRERARIVMEEKRPIESQDEVYLKLDGTPMDVEVSVVPIRYEGRDGALVFIRDIAERKKAEKVLHESETLLRSVLEMLPVGVFLINQSGQIDMLNPAGQEIWNGNRHVGIGCYGEYRAWWADTGKRVTPEQWNAARAIRNGETSINEEIEIESFDGTRKFILCSALPIRDSTGRIKGAIAVNVDITARKRAEKALREQALFLQILIDSIPAPVFFKDHEGRYIGCNNEFTKLRGLSQEAIVGKTIFDLAPRPRAEVNQAMDEKLFLDRSNQVYEQRVQYADGILHDVILNKAPFTDEAGNIKGLVGIMLDVTEQKKVEKSLREREKQMRALLDNIPDIVWLKDTESRYIAANEPFGKVCGLKPEDLVGKTDLDLWPKELAESYRTDDKEVIQSCRPKRIEEFIEDATGKRNWIETFKTPIRNDRGDVIGTTGIARDITERKRVEDLYRMLSDRSLAGVYVVQDGIFKYLNANAASYAGYGPEELVGRESSVLFHPEDRAIARQYAGEMLRGVRQTPYEYRIINKAGEIRWILETVTTIPYEGKPAVLGNSMDISQLKEAQQKLEELQALESSVLSAIPHAVLGLDHRRIVFANDNVETVFGWKPAEIIDRDLAVFFSSEAACETVIRRIETALQTGMVYSLEPEHPLVHRDGRAQDCRVTAARIGSGSGDGFVTIFEDITEQKMSQLHLLQSEKMASIGQLAAGVAHEINNPTGYVSSNLKTLSEYFEDVMGILLRYRALLSGVRELVEKAKLDGNLAGLVGDIEAMEQKVDIDYILKDAPVLIHESREGTERIKEIVLSLKNFAHPGEERFSYSDVHKNLDSTLNVVWNELKYKTTVRKEYGELPEVECYPQQINQVFMNMLVNAAQAIKVKGEIAIRTRSLGDVVEISISDTGVGIPKENLARIFDPFFTTKEVGKGTGLGLNVAYNIVKKHRGEIDVKSKIGEGTTFTIRLPVHQAEAMA